MDWSLFQLLIWIIGSVIFTFVLLVKQYVLKFNLKVLKYSIIGHLLWFYTCMISAIVWWHMDKYDYCNLGAVTIGNYAYLLDLFFGVVMVLPYLIDLECNISKKTIVIILGIESIIPFIAIIVTPFVDNCDVYTSPIDTILQSWCFIVSLVNTMICTYYIKNDQFRATLISISLCQVIYSGINIYLNILFNIADVSNFNSIYTLDTIASVIPGIFNIIIVLYVFTLNKYILQFFNSIKVSNVVSNTILGESNVNLTVTKSV